MLSEHTGTQSVVLGYTSTLMIRLVFPLFVLGCVPEPRAFRSPSGALSAETSNLDFGSVPLGHDKARFLTLSNTGNATLEVAIELGGATDAFRIMRDSLILGAFESTALEIRFRPETQIPPSESLLVMRWASGAEQAEIGITGSASLDADGDGQTDSRLGGTDCDDTDAEIYWGAVEVWYDDVDSDCDGESDFDQDADGFERMPQGADCDDTNENRYPGQADGTQDDPLPGIDSDCDGFVDEDALNVGDFLITEAMVLPGNLKGSFIEFKNTSQRTLVLDGWELVVNNRIFSWPSGLVVESGSFLLACDLADRALGWQCDLEWGGAVEMGAGSGMVQVGPPALLLDGITWDSTWPIVPEASIQVDPDFQTPAFNDSATSWCASIQTMTDGNLGTPGTENDFCLPEGS